MIASTTLLPLANRQEAFQILSWVENQENYFIRVAFRIAAVALITIFIPILEEYIFRELYWVERIPHESILSTVQRIGGNGAIFGSCHFSPFQTGDNFSIILATTVLGILYAIMREVTGGRLLSTISHMAQNTMVMMTHYQLVE